MDLGQYLKNTILSRNLSIRDFSEKSAISYDLICNVIYGKTKSTKVLTKIALALGISPENVINNRDYKTIISAFVEMNSDDQQLHKIKQLILARLDFFKVTSSENLIIKITDAVYYCSRQIEIVNEPILQNMIDAVISYGIMESKIKER